MPVCLAAAGGGEQGHISMQPARLGAEKVPQHPLMETAGLGSAGGGAALCVPSTSPGCSCLKAQHHPGSKTSNETLLGAPLCALGGFTTYRPHPAPRQTHIQGLSAGKSNTTISRSVR